MGSIKFIVVQSEHCQTHHYVPVQVLWFILKTDILLFHFCTIKLLIVVFVVAVLEKSITKSCYPCWSKDQSLYYYSYSRLIKSITFRWLYYYTINCWLCCWISIEKSIPRSYVTNFGARIKVCTLYRSTRTQLNSFLSSLNIDNSQRSMYLWQFDDLTDYNELLHNYLS